MAIQGSDGVFVIKLRPVLAAAPRHRAHRVVPTASQASAARAPAALERVSARDSEGPWLLRLDADYDHGGGSGSGTATLSGEYFMTAHFAGALAVALPRSASGARVQTSALTLKYYFAPEDRLRPYLGVGFAITARYDGAGVGTSRTSIGATVQGGLDLKLAAHWFVNADVSWTQAPHLDPVQFGLGLAYRF
jgi:outer membrane protein W